MSNRTYDVLKYVAQIVLPALATFYFAIAQIWNLPYAEEIVGTISALALLGISSRAYFKEQEEHIT